MNEKSSKLFGQIAKLRETGISGEASLLLDELQVDIKAFEENFNLQNARVLHAERLASLADMATGVAHELNQPFNVILMAAQMVRMWLKKGKDLDLERLDKLMEDIEISVRRGSKIITHMRQFGSGSSYHTMPLDINKPIVEIFDLLSQQLKAEDVVVEMQLGEDLPPIKADNYQVQQIFFQLISNARDAMSEKVVAVDGNSYHKKIVITTRVDENLNVSASLFDNGSGILESNLKKIFDPFFTTKEVGKGKGLGLAIIYGLAQDFGGSIEAESELGVGSKFTLVFPPA